MAFRHWFRSDEITTLLNRLGHSETYSLSLELETSIAIAVETTSTLLSPQIVRNPNVPFIFHSDFDNFDQLLIKVITKLPNSEQSYKGKVKTHNYINRQNQSTTENCENRNDPDLVQAFLKKWWVESDFKAPNLPLSLRFKGSGCHCNSI